MKTFLDLVKEVQKPGLCHHCGGCVTFCTAINYGALKLDDNGMPCFASEEKCIECGLCYSICPEINEIKEETRKLVSWKPPMGNVLETHIARSKDPVIRDQATDGGVVTGLLVHLFDRGHIDGAIVAKQVDLFSREPSLAVSRDEIIEAAGSCFDLSHGMKHLRGKYSTYAPSAQEFRPMLQQHLKRVALVGTPCQIEGVRRIEALGIVPSDVIKYCFGLFCSGNFTFGDSERKKMETLGKFKWEDIKKINVKDGLVVHLNSGEKRVLKLENLDFMKRYACHYCNDYSAEYADISFGGIGAEEGWTTVITRTALGRATFADACDSALEKADYRKNPDCTSNAFNKVRTASDLKKKNSGDNRGKLGKN